MILSLINGTLFKKPEEKISKSKNPYTSLTLKVANGNEMIFVRVFVFSDTAREELVGVDDGDAISVVGSLSAETYERGGKPRISYSLSAERVMALKPKKKAPKEKPFSISPQKDAGRFGDDVPF